MQGPIYPPSAPVPYSSGHQQQQPLFIIIPSTSGKSHKPKIVPYDRSFSSSILEYPNNLLHRRSLLRSNLRKAPKRVVLQASGDNLMDRAGPSNQDKFLISEEVQSPSRADLQLHSSLEDNS